MPVYESRVALPGPAERVFDFLIQPANLQQISPPEVQMAFVQAPEILSLGSKFTFKIQVMGQVQQFEHEIVEFERPHKFREKATATPMKSWIQDYIIEPADNGGVTLVTRIDFEPPGGFLGYILTPERIISNLEEGHLYRHDALQKALQ